MSQSQRSLGTSVIQSRPADRLSQKLFRSGDSGKQPLTPTMAILSCVCCNPIALELSSPIELLSELLWSFEENSGARSPLECPTISSTCTRLSTAASRWKLAVCACCWADSVSPSMRAPKCALICSLLLSNIYSLNSAMVGDSKNTVGMSSKPYVWFKVFPKVVKLTESNPNSLNSAWGSTSSSFALSCLQTVTISTDWIWFSKSVSLISTSWIVFCVE